MDQLDLVDLKYSLQFVVLHHTGVAKPHFDLFFETVPGSDLSALRCDEWPPTSKTIFEFALIHRRHYLTYEGPVSDNRGSVLRVAAGRCRIVPVDGGTQLRFENAAFPAIYRPNTG